MGKIRVALLAGGWSGERAVSLKSGEAMFAALDKSKYDGIILDPRDKLDDLLAGAREIDIAFSLLHGRFGEDGCIQGLLNILGIPFVGSDVLSSAMALHKKIAKTLYQSNGLEVARDVILLKGEGFSVNEIQNRLGAATVVKPVKEGSSLGMSICYSSEELREGIQEAFLHDREVMVEEYISGREVTCCVIGNRDLETLPLIEIVPKAPYRFFDYKAKYTPGATDEICPAPLAEALSERARSCAMTAHRALRCDVWSRTDMIIREEKIYLLETNTIPGMTESSLFPLAARQAGMSLSALLDRLITLSLELRA